MQQFKIVVDSQLEVTLLMKIRNESTPNFFRLKDTTKQQTK